MKIGEISVVRVKAQETNDVMVPVRFNATGNVAQQHFDLHLEGMHPIPYPPHPSLAPFNPI